MARSRELAWAFRGRSRCSGRAGSCGCGVQKRRRVRARDGHPRRPGPDVGHVRQQQGPHLVRNLPEAGPVEVAGVGGGPDDDHPGLVLPRQAGHLVVVDALRLRVHPVGEEAVELGGEVDPVSRGSGAPRRGGPSPARRRPAGGAPSRPPCWRTSRSGAARWRARPRTARPGSAHASTWSTQVQPW